jgi:hypothetical protein
MRRFPPEGGEKFFPDCSESAIGQYNSEKLDDDKNSFM